MMRSWRFLQPTQHTVWVLVPAALLCAIGLASIYGIQMGDVGTAGERSFQRQLVYLGVSVTLMALTIMTSYQRIGRHSYLIYALCFGLLAALVVDRWVHVPGVLYIRGSRRWIRIAGFQVQPSEVMKIGYLLAIAWYLRFRKNYRTVGGLIGPFLLTLVPMVLIKMQPDLGMTLIMLPVLFAMLFVAGARLRHLAVIVLAALAALPLFWTKMEMYQRLRVTAVILQSSTIRQWIADHPQAWLRLGPPEVRRSPEAAREWLLQATEWEIRRGYQLVRSKTALGSGGVTGNGWGKGTFVDYDFLPDKHNDFIFAMVGHQFGLIGCVFVLLCYAAIVVTGFDIATLTNDPFGKLLAVGITMLLATQVLTNIAMTIGLGPITGLTLPFVSYGGSSLIATFVMIGLLINIAQRRPLLIAHDPFVFAEERE
jgi:rod shape determining protein RodA